MLAAFSATLGGIAALFIGFLAFRFWRVTLALLALAIIGVVGVIGYIFYEDARTARILAEQRAEERAASERIDSAVLTRSCTALANAIEAEKCSVIMNALDRKKLAEYDREKRAKAEAESRAAKEEAAKQAPSPVEGTGKLDTQAVDEFLKTLEPKAN
jgi:hypothetical protein